MAASTTDVSAVAKIQSHLHSVPMLATLSPKKTKRLLSIQSFLCWCVLRIHFVRHKKCLNPITCYLNVPYNARKPYSSIPWNRWKCFNSSWPTRDMQYRLICPQIKQRCRAKNLHLCHRQTGTWKIQEKVSSAHESGNTLPSKRSLTRVRTLDAVTLYELNQYQAPVIACSNERRWDHS